MTTGATVTTREALTAPKYVQGKLMSPEFARLRRERAKLIREWLRAGYTVQEIADALGVHRGSVWDMRQY